MLILTIAVGIVLGGLLLRTILRKPPPPAQHTDTEAAADEITPEVYERYQRIRFGCAYIEMVAGDLQSRVPEIRDTAPAKIDAKLVEVLTQLATIDDEFTRLAGTHKICVALVAANKIETAKLLFAQVEDEMFRTIILTDCPTLAAN